MLFRRIKTPGLAHHAYVLACGRGHAVVVDPRRDAQDYLEIARTGELTITHILHTHRQEDFEFGSAALAAQTGARIVAGTHALFQRADVRLGDGEALEIGSTRFVACSTPGHTPESVSYAVYPETSKDVCWGVFTGDALFVGETGRTDLEDASKAGENAGRLYDAIHGKIAPLGDQALVFPAHGAGSACGGNISDRDDSTLGLEKRTNPVFLMSRAEFVEHKRSEKLPRPPYFAHMEEVNLEGGRPMRSPALVRVLQPRPFAEAGKSGIIIDTRAPDAYAGAHVPGSYNIWLEGLSTFGGWIAEGERPIFLVTASPDSIETAVIHLARVGIDSVQAVLGGGVAAWREAGLAFHTAKTVTPAEAAAWLREKRVHILDVRDDMEWAEGHIPGARHVYVGELERKLDAVPGDKPVVVHCSVGNRSGLAVSMLLRHGRAETYNMLGGMKAWRSLALPLAHGEAA